MIPVAAFSSYRRAIDEAQGLPDLDPLLRPFCREPFRRIDRFVQLALMGSAACIQGRAVDPKCGLYVGTINGPVSNNVVVQETLFKHKLLPKPFNFVNTLGSSTGYYLTKNLGLKGQALYISHRPAAFDAALMCAFADLEIGVSSQALVGMVEEIYLPLAQHRARIGRPAGSVMIEESHWLLLDKNAAPSVTLADLSGLVVPLGQGSLEKLAFR